jgi:hypothetical protein
MNNLIKKVPFIALILISISCKKKDPEPTAAELMEGKWVVSSSELLGTVVPGDGSYLRFDACASTCSGVDYKVSDTTSGTFTYSINDEATLLSITDNSSDGGSWSGEWDILELTETDLRMTTSTAFGSFKVELTK